MIQIAIRDRSFSSRPFEIITRSHKSTEITKKADGEIIKNKKINYFKMFGHI